MFASNHGMAGMVIGSLLPTPIAIPVAFVSHFIMDAIPHYGPPKGNRTRKSKYETIVHLDSLLALSFALITAWSGRWDMFWIGWVAYGPDGYWVYLYYKQKRNFNIKANNWFARFHKAIQTEVAWGMKIEAPIALILFST